MINKPTSFRWLDQKDKRGLEQRAKKERRSMNFLINEAIKLYLKQPTTK